MESEFPQRNHRNAWHDLTISDQCVIIIGSMCERLMPGNNSVPKLLKTCELVVPVLISYAEMRELNSEEGSVYIRL